MKKADQDQALRDMIEHDADLKHFAYKPRVVGPNGVGQVTSAGQFLLQTFVFPQRNGVVLGMGEFCAAKLGRGHVLRAATAALTYAMHPDGCRELFGNKATMETQGFWWGKGSDRRMLDALKRIQPDLRRHPVVDQMVDDLLARAAQAPTPADLYMQDLKVPLAAAIAKGASRDDILRLVDETLAESVMKAYGVQTQRFLPRSQISP